MALLQIKNLNFTYPDAAEPALSDIDLTVEEGEFLVLCGRSGSGKTTLLKHMKPQLTPHGERTGAILFRGTAVESMSLREQSSEIGYVLQDPEDQVVTDKVWHELSFGLESLGTDRRTMRIRVAEMAQFFGIQDWFYRDVNDLSGGQKQLLSLASIMAMQPSLLILDEPTSQLDPIAAGEFFRMLHKISRELGTAVILSEHRLEEALPMADHAVVMEGGRIIADGTPVQVGRMLHEAGHPMMAAMPAPMRIYYGTEAGDRAILTVRDGKRWLGESISGTGIRHMEGIPERREFEHMSSGEQVLSVKEVWFRYGKDRPDVLQGVTLNLCAGELLCVLGGNGTGKSTLLKCISRLERPYRGKILLGGKDIAKMSPKELYSRGIAMLPQDPKTLFAGRTVREELAEMNPPEDTDAQGRTLTDRVIEVCELGKILDTHPYDLSGGERQRTALAKVLLCRPKVLLLDEPTKGMDNLYKKKFMKLLEKLRSDGTAILMVSHDVEFCAAAADRAALFSFGEIVAEDKPREFFSGNSFYTTAANRMSRDVFRDAVTDEDVIERWNRCISR